MQHSNTAGCILLKFYIKPQHTANVYNLLYVVSYRNSTSNHNFFSQCYGNLEVVSYRNSTSNHNKSSPYVNKPELYLIEILHQTTTRTAAALISIGCILSKFYIKPQLLASKVDNNRGCILSKFYIKPQLWPTQIRRLKGCILSKFYIKPQLRIAYPVEAVGCILSKFYIKPQPIHSPP